jgi:hypothetical protein
MMRWLLLFLLLPAMRRKNEKPVSLVVDDVPVPSAANAGRSSKKSGRGA